MSRDHLPVHPGSSPHYPSAYYYAPAVGAGSPGSMPPPYYYQPHPPSAPVPYGAVGTQRYGETFPQQSTYESQSTQPPQDGLHHPQHTPVGRGAHPIPIYDQFRPPPNPLADIYVHIITQSVTQLIDSHHRKTDAAVDRLQEQIDRLATEVSGAQQKTRACMDKVVEVLKISEKYHLGRLERLENMLGMGEDARETLIDKLKSLEFGVEELVEAFGHDEETSRSRVEKATSPGPATPSEIIQSP